MLHAGSWAGLSGVPVASPAFFLMSAPRAAPPLALAYAGGRWPGRDRADRALAAANLRTFVLSSIAKQRKRASRERSPVSRSARTLHEGGPLNAPSRSRRGALRPRPDRRTAQLRRAARGVPRKTRSRISPSARERGLYGWLSSSRSVSAKRRPASATNPMSYFSTHSSCEEIANRMGDQDLLPTVLFMPPASSRHRSSVSGVMAVLEDGGQRPVTHGDVPQAIRPRILVVADIL